MGSSWHVMPSVLQNANDPTVLRRAQLVFCDRHSGIRDDGVKIFDTLNGMPSSLLPQML